MKEELTMNGLDKETREALISSTEALSDGRDKRVYPDEMCKHLTNTAYIEKGEFKPSATVKRLSLSKVERRRHDVRMEEIKDLLSHPAVFHTPLQEKGDYAFCMLQSNMMTLVTDGRAPRADVTNMDGEAMQKRGFFKKALGTGFAFGSSAEFPYYHDVAMSPDNGLPVVTGCWRWDGLDFTVESYVTGSDDEPVGSYDYKRILWRKLWVRNPSGVDRTLPVFVPFSRKQWPVTHYARHNGFKMAPFVSGLLDVDIRSREIFYREKLLCVANLPDRTMLEPTTCSGHREGNGLDAETLIPCFRLTVPAGEGIECDFRINLTDRPLTTAEESRIRDLDYETQRSRCVKRWEKALGRGAQFSIPEKAMADAVRAQIACLHQTHHRFVETEEILYPNQGPAWPMNDWPFESRCCVKAFDQLGLTEDAGKVLEYYCRRQVDWMGPNGNVTDWCGAFYGCTRWMMETGCVLSAMAEHYLLSRDRGWLKEKRFSALMAMDWIHGQREANKLDCWRASDSERPLHYGLLPAGRANDGPEKVFDYASNDCPTWEGLNLMSKAFLDAGLELPAHLSDEVEDYRKCLLRVVEAVKDSYPENGFIPQVVYPKKGEEPWAWFGMIIHLLSTGVIPESSPLYQEILDKIDTYLEANECRLLGLTGRMDEPHMGDRAKDGYLRCGIRGAEWYISVADHFWHRRYLEKGEIRKAVLVLYSQVAFGLTDTLQCSERISVVDPYWAPVQVNPSGSARLITMFGTAFVLERTDSLSFFRGIPAHWLTAGKKVALNGWKTRFGTIDCELAVSDSGDEMKGLVRLVGWRTRTGGDIVLRHPAGKILVEARVNGTARRDFNDDRIRVDDFSEPLRFEVVFARDRETGRRPGPNREKR